MSCTKAQIPLFPLVVSEVAKRIHTSASGPFVIQFFVPEMTYSSPSLRAVVLIAAASLPVPGSESAKQPSALPDASRGRKHSFCCWVPNSRIGEIQSDVWALTIMPVEAHAAESSSMMRA
jgi:hypothetical protein